MYGVSVNPLLSESGGMVDVGAELCRLGVAGGGECAGDAGTCAGAGGAVAGAVVRALHFLAAASCALSEPWPPQIMPEDAPLCFDFIVAGGGTAGAALAARLVAAGAQVLLVEAGGDPPAEAIIPGFKETLLGGEYDWQFTTQDDGVSSQALRGGRQPQPRGRMLGGCGSLNDMVYARGFPADYDSWAATLRRAGDPDAHRWAWDRVLDLFKRTENLTDARILDDPQLMQLHGVRGEIEVAGVKESSFETSVFLAAFQEMGFPLVRDMTSPLRLGAGRHSHTVRRGRRHTTLTALLNAQRDNPNLFVLKHALVTKVLIEKSTAYGVRVLHDGRSYDLHARREVILTAGTFNTPKILMMSGVGPKPHLEELGIPVVQDLPVGRNLHDHVMVLSYIAADRGTCAARGAGAEAEAERHVHLAQYLAGGGGPLARVDTMAAYLAFPGSTEPTVPDFAFYPSCMPVGTDFYPHCTTLLRFSAAICRQLQAVLRDRELISVAAVLLRPQSRGRVELGAADPTAPPLIYSGTFSDASDLDGFPEAIGVVKRMLNTKYFKAKNAQYVDLDIEACKGAQGAERVKCVSRATALGAWHSAGTAALGAVLDGRLRIRGVAGLRVADASAMPRVVRANTNTPVHMIAEQAAEALREEYHFRQLPAPCRAVPIQS